MENDYIIHMAYFLPVKWQTICALASYEIET